MLTKEQRARFFPKVNKAWTEHCRLAGTSPNNKPTYDSWYRDQLHCSIGVWTTKEADPEKDFLPLLDWFTLLAGEPQPIIIKGWTESQSAWFEREAKKAHNMELSRGSPSTDFGAWVSALLIECGILNHTAHDHKESFDSVMAYVGTISADERLISHFAEAAEIRMRWQIKRSMADLSYLEKTHVSWGYVRAIWTQSDLLPALDEAPAATMVKVLQMLDTHIRRLCAKSGMRPRDLPSR